MKKICHFSRCMTLLIALMNVVIIDSAMTYKQMQIAGAMMRETCKPQFDVTDERIDGLKIGKFPDDDNLRCYVNCILELMTILRNGVANYDLTVKQMTIMLPEELREPYVNGVNACRNAAEGIKDKCQIAYKLIECFERNNPQFMFP